MKDIEIVTHRPHVEAILARYADCMGRDLAGYRNHVYRAITYALHFLGQAPQHVRLVETAFAYHDIGLWTDRELAYLEPSEAVALADNHAFGWGLNPEALQAAIHWHHKVFAYHGPHAELVEACRKADWVDASQGLLRKGLSRATVRAVEAAFPNEGFHASLLRLARDYGGSTWVGGLRVTRGIVKW